MEPRVVLPEAPWRLPRGPPPPPFQGVCRQGLGLGALPATLLLSPPLNPGTRLCPSAEQLGGKGPAWGGHRLGGQGLSPGWGGTHDWGGPRTQPGGRRQMLGGG